MAPDASANTLTRLLGECRQGSPTAYGELFSSVYDALRGVARRHIGPGSTQHTLQPTALVNEAFLRLGTRDSMDWTDRSHFLRAVGAAMRSVLIDYARSKSRLKRGGGAARVPIEPLMLSYESRAVDVLQLDEALGRLRGIGPELEELVELRFFAGCSVEDAAAILGQSKRSVERDWHFARRWLFNELKP